ncbi:MAG: hypothetical protein H0X16_04435 [Chloroflexi bacterium]|nr:hypothetical protein [Chloroflexota bacterium]
MSNLLGEIALRLAKAGAAGILGAIVYAIATGPLEEPGSIGLALLSWLSGAAFILLIQEGPI